jgi:hypothetical protein
MITSVLPCFHRSVKTFMMSVPEDVSRFPGRLVGEEDVGVHGERAGDGDALHLAARQLGRLVVHAVAEADALEELGRRARGVPSGDSAEEQRHLDVLECADLREQVEVLEDEADAAVPDLGELVAREARDLSPASW